MASRQGLRGVVVETLMITPSGALSPGLLSASAVAIGASLGALGGLAVAFGHMVFELPYVALLVFWAERLERLLSRVEKPLALATLAIAAYFSWGLLAAGVEALRGGSVISAAGSVEASSLLDAVLYGVGFTGANPYFLAWWLTIGLPLVRGAARYGVKGFAAMYLSHVWMDYAWLALLAVLGAGAVAASGLYGLVLVVLAAVLLVFGVDVAVRAFTGRRLLPF